MKRAQTELTLLEAMADGAGGEEEEFVVLSSGDESVKLDGPPAKKLKTDAAAAAVGNAATATGGAAKKQQTVCVERGFSHMTCMDANARRRRLQEPHFRDNLMVHLHREWLRVQLRAAL